MNIWTYLEKRSKRRSLEKLRKHYLSKYEKNESTIECIFSMDWDDAKKLSQWKYMKAESAIYKNKVLELEEQIKLL